MRDVFRLFYLLILLILLIFATHRYGNMSAARYQGNQGYQWLKINVDARRALSIIFLNLRFLLIELIFATRRGGVLASG